MLASAFETVLFDLVFIPVGPYHTLVYGWL